MASVLVDNRAAIAIDAAKCYPLTWNLVAFEWPERKILVPLRGFESPIS